VVEDVLADGEVLYGGGRITDGDLAAGNFVAPTVVVAPDDSSVWTDEQAEIERFLAGIEAGVVYVNRAAGATTGAWPGVQPFGGWKRSGTAGKAGGGPYYLQQYLREQSRTVVEH
jgi:acyl-CoA reductase-like NAD-dependent aldehyde dehydrogenase